MMPDSEAGVSADPKSVNNMSSIEQELYFLIAKFLSSGPCQRTYQALTAELEEHKLLPKQISWSGRERTRSYENLLALNGHIESNHLLKICQRIGQLLNKEVKPSVEGVASLLGAGRQSLLRTADDVASIRWLPQTYSVLYHNQPVCPPVKFAHPANIVHVMSARQQSGRARHDHVVTHYTYSRISQLYRSLGHLSAVYCCAFDRTGSRVFTGADDHLVKVWSSLTGRLQCTLRGHSAEITDIACNSSNTLLAAGSCDKLIRVWCLRTSAPVAVLHGHSHMITSVRFCPHSRGDSNYMVSTGGDGCLCFWEYNAKTNVFNQKPIKFIERSRAGTQMLCSSFSAGGIFLATGSSDCIVRVYCFSGLAPEKICELELHTDRIDSIQYASNDCRFVSGSKDGTARIWRFERQEWKAIVLNASEKLQSDGTVRSTDENSLSKYRVTMICWSTDDTYVLTAVNDFSLKVWRSCDGKLVHILKGHQDELFVLEQHPVDTRIVLSAGHDGRIILWDIVAGVSIKTFFNAISGQGHGAVFDCKWSPDGQSFAATDSHGFVMMFGFGSSDKAKLPEDMFFHTDYRPLIRDANNYVLDEQTQQPPHLMPPPFLVDLDGNPHPARYQRLVPGRENCLDGQLVPLVVVSQTGEREVLDFPNDQEELPPDDATANENGEERPLLDEMIARMQQEHDQRDGVANGNQVEQPSSSSRRHDDEQAARSSRRRGPDINTVRGVSNLPSSSTSSASTSGSAQAAVAAQAPSANMSVWTRRILVRELDPFVAETAEKNRNEMADVEIKAFLEERKKKPLTPSQMDKNNSASYLRTRRLGKHGQHGQRSAVNEETGRNLLFRKALYDTETEESSNVEAAGVAEREQPPKPRATFEELKTVLGADASSDGDTTEHSDWVPDASGSDAPKRRSKRKVKPRRWTSSEEGSADSSDTTSDTSDEDDDDEETDVENANDKTEKGQSSNAEVSDGNEKKRDKRPAVRNRQRPQPSRTRKKPGKDKRKPQKKKVEKLDENTIRELAPDCRPPEWLTDVLPRKTPYIPQIGDEVIYFMQGHQQYVEAVKAKNVYAIDAEKNQPWHKMPYLREQELMKVMKIKYEIRPPRGLRLVSLKLAFIDPETSRPTGSSFSIKYHDMSGVVDFIILRQTYNIANSHNWTVGDRFRCLIDDSWWIGTVVGLEPFQAEYPDSMFQCINALWDNGETEKLSPWDLEPLDNRRLPTMNGASVPVTEHELRGMRYMPQPGEWPAVGRDVECDRIVAGLEQIMSLSIAESFAVPVDLNAFPLYALIIAYPVDLSTVKARLENRFYRRVAAVQYDVQHIESNARTFNDSQAAIVQHAHIITELCLKFIRDDGCHDPMKLYAQLTKGKNVGISSHLDDADNSEDDDDDEVQQQTSSGSNKRKMLVRGGQRRSSTGEQRKNTWEQDAESVLHMIMDSVDSMPFRSPVKIAEFPDYSRVISAPMDLGTVLKKLQTKHYESLFDFCRDVRLIFSNSRTYNTNKRSRIYAMTLRLSSLFEDRIKNTLQKHKSSSLPTSNSGSRSVRNMFDRAKNSRRATSPSDTAYPISSHNSQANNSGRERLRTTSPYSAVGASRTARNHPVRAAAKRSRYADDDDDGTECDDDEEDRKRPRMSGNSSLVSSRLRMVAAVSQPRRMETRRRGSRTSRWLSDSDGNEQTECTENPYLNSGNEEADNGSDEEFTLPSQRRAGGTSSSSARAVVQRNAPVARTKKAQTSNVSNGHSSERYSTRCSTGVISRKRYDKIFSDDEDNQTVGNRVGVGHRASRKPDTRNSDEFASETVSRNNHASNSRAFTVSKQSKSLKMTSLSSSGVNRASRSKHANSDEEEEDNETETESSSASTTEFSSELDTEPELDSDSATDVEEYLEEEEVHDTRKTASSSGVGRRQRLRADVEDDEDAVRDNGRKYRTRNRGRRTVRYNEESDGGDSGNDGRKRSGLSRNASSVQNCAR